MIDENMLQQYQQEIDLARQQATNQNVNQAAQALQLSQETTNLVKEQLSLSEELESIRHLLRGDDLVTGTDGVQTWEAATDEGMVIFTNYGIHLIMNTIMFYLNKNTLLSNYEEEVILQKMEDFATSLSDVIFMEYEKVFQYPSTEECHNNLIDRLKRKQETIIKNHELRGLEFDKIKIWAKLINEIYDYEKEITKIREQIMKNKLKRFDIIMREIQDAVHSTYLRAWNGQERRSIRQHINIQENVGGVQMLPRAEKKGLSKWFGR